MSLTPLSCVRGVISALTLFACIQALAQGNLNAGLPEQNVASVQVPLGSVDTSSGNLLLSIPIVSVPQRHGPPATVAFVYNSSFWYQSSSGSMYPGDFEGVGLSNGLDVVVSNGIGGNLSFATTVTICAGNPTPPKYAIRQDSFRYTDSYGGSVQFAAELNDQTACGLPLTGSYAATNRNSSSTYSLLLTPSGSGGGLNNIQVWDGDGTELMGTANSHEDTNGNYSVSIPGDTATGDQLGRAVISTSCSTPSWRTQGGTCTLTVPSSNGPVAYTLVYASSPVCSNFTMVPSTPQGLQYCGSLALPVSLTRPDGSQYLFTWDTGSAPGHYGTLTNVTTPGGAHLSYTYVMNSAPNNPIAIQTVSDGHGTTSFAYALNAPAPVKYTGATATAYYTTTVTQPPRYDAIAKTSVNDQTIHTYGLFGGPTVTNPGFPNFLASGPPQLVQSKMYSGAALLKTVLRNPTSNAPFGPVSVTTTLNDTGQASTSTITYLPYTNLIQTIQEDTGQPDSRTTVSTYVSDNNSQNIPYNSGYHIYNLPVSKIVYPGNATSGTPVSAVYYTYDEYSAGYCTGPMLSAVTGASGHDDTRGTSYIGRGNRTSTTKLINGSTYSTSHQCFDTLGNVTQAVDPLGNKTSYSYADAWYDSACSVSATYSAPTTITDALGHVTKRKYWTCSSSIAQQQDPNDTANGRAGTLWNYDFLGRTLKVTNADGGRTTTIFSDTAANGAPNVQTSTCLLNCAAGSATSLSTKTLLDDLGRPIQSQLISDPQGTDYQDTVYDAGGRVSSVSNTYRSTSDPAYGLTISNYDGLGRQVLLTHPDNFQQSWLFNGTTTTFTDEGGSQWARTQDYLGHLIKVLEPSMSSKTPTLEVDYQYDLNDNLTNVSQLGASGDTARSRSFSYDASSRLLWSQNPESGVICYGTISGGGLPSVSNCPGNGYDANGNISSKTDARGVITNYLYDGLNRLRSKTYTNDSVATATTCFIYDSGGGANQVGRLTADWTQPPSAGACASTVPSGSLTSRVINGYDAMGRSISETQCVGIFCSKDVSGANTYSYDFAGNLTSSSDLIGTRLFANIYDSAGRLSTLSVSTSETTPVNLFSSPIYSAFGGLAAVTYGTSLNLTRSYDSRLRVTKEIDTGILGPPGGSPATVSIGVVGGVQSK